MEMVIIVRSPETDTNTAESLVHHMCAGTNYWSVNAKDRGSLPLESYALDHALLLWGFVDAAAERIEWYLQNYVRAADGACVRVSLLYHQGHVSESRTVLARYS
eukprot:COSAG02_NODE_285_length_25646_cov_10.858143_21_plen_104_part_00